MMRTTIFRFVAISCLTFSLSCIATKNVTNDNLDTDSSKEVPTSTAVADNSFTITGTVKNLDNGSLVLSYSKGGYWAEDPIQVVDGKFTVKGKVDYPRAAYIANPTSQAYPMEFFLGNYNMTADFDAATGDITIKGSPIQDEFLAFKELTDAPFAQKLDELYMSYSNADKESKMGIEKEINEVTAEKNVLVEEYILNNTNSFVSAYAISNTYGVDPDIKSFEKVYNALSSTIKDSEVGLKIAQTLEIAKKTAVGNQSIDLTVNDADGNPLKLSDLKGKYVLLEFWASWCGPCRQENPKMKEVYQKFKDKGFEIYAVSLDVSKRDWVNAIQADDLPWLHVSDLTPSNAAATTYGVQGIPMNYLLDDEGKIIAKALTGDGLEAELGKIF